MLDDTADKKPVTPEKGVPPKDKPDIGSKPDLENPATPEKEIPGKPIQIWTRQVRTNRTKLLS